MSLRHLILVSVVVGTSGTALAQTAAPSSSPSVAALAACRATADPAARLACYDRAVPTLLGAASSGDLAIIDRQQAREVRRTLFGFAVPDLPFFKKRPGRAEDEAPKELVSTVRSFSSLGNDRFRFAITDGNALWESTESAQLRDPRQGEKVTIQRGAIGSFFAQFEGQRAVRVRRVR
jgi:hypothetical protein